MTGEHMGFGSILHPHPLAFASQTVVCVLCSFLLTFSTAQRPHEGLLRVALAYGPLYMLS